MVTALHVTSDVGQLAMEFVRLYKAILVDIGVTEAICVNNAVKSVSLETELPSTYTKLRTLYWQNSAPRKVQPLGFLLNEDKISIVLSKLSDTYR